MQFTITPQQADELAEVLRDHVDGEPVTFTMQGNGDVVVAFSLCTVTISEDGERADD